jgi:hypothetical protein
VPRSFRDRVVELNVLLDVIEFQFDLFRVVISTSKILKSLLGLFWTILFKEPTGAAE